MHRQQQTASKQPATLAHLEFDQKAIYTEQLVQSTLELLISGMALGVGKDQSYASLQCFI